MPEIEAFAAIGDYIDQPLRTYSSGMAVRLAFSVATALRPDILIVDEALSVGDAYFQHKSFNRIREFRKQGTTLLIVSHDRSAIQSLCDRAVLLERGFVIKDGNPEEVMDFYNAIIAEKENATIEVKRLEDGRAQTTSGTGEARVESIALLNQDNEAVEFINVGQWVRLKVDIRIYANLPELTFGYMIKDRLGQPVFVTNTHHLGVQINQLKQGEKLTLVFSFPANIGLGSYSVSTALHVADTHLTANYEWRDLALMFNVVNIDRDTFVGVSWIPPEVEYQR
jgi:lipopolysaccharide transport system ATP-binding protein